MKRKTKKRVMKKGKKVAAARKKAPNLKRKKLAGKRKKSSNAKKKVTTTPKGYNSVTPYLVVNDASNAIEFYKRIFGAREVMRMTTSEGKVGHCELKIGDAKVMVADENPESNTPIGIHLYIKNVDDVVNQAVAAGARLVRPTETMSYGDRSGTIEDPYGNKWYVSTHVENVSHSEMKKRMAEMNKKY